MATLLRRYGTLIGFILILAFFWFRLPDTFMTARNWLSRTRILRSRVTTCFREIFMA